MRQKMEPLPQKGRGGCLLGFPIPRPTPPRVLATLKIGLGRLGEDVEEARRRGEGRKV